MDSRPVVRDGEGKDMKLFVILVFSYIIVLCSGDPGEPLFLTPLIESGNAEEARDASRVGSLQPDVDIESYSGFITVNIESCEIHLFFWYFPAESGAQTTPLVISLEGGPGQPIGSGIFESHGPWKVKEDNVTLEKRDYYWSQKYNVLFIDSPVGSGFSYTDNTTCYSTNQIQVAENLYEALLQFYQVFHEMKQVDLFVTGISYGGKFAPSLAYKIHIENQNADFKIHLKGVATGSGFTDPPNMTPHAYADFVYEHGLIDNNTRQNFKAKESYLSSLMESEQWELGHSVWLEYTLSVRSVTGVEMQNYLYSPSDPNLNGRYKSYIQMDTVRAAIHVGDSHFDNQSLVISYMVRDFLMSVKQWFVALLEEGYRILVYTGQLDILVNYPQTMNFLNNLQWSGADEYKAAPRSKWFVKHELAGYTKRAKNLVEALVRNAGHDVPANQPKWCLDLLSRFFDDEPL